MFRTIITPLLFCCLTAFAAPNTIELQKDHPDNYVVVKGDTLWDISGKFLQSPWEWPKVWQMNRDQIKNPHWIYPGDVIVLDMSSGSPQLRLLKETTKTVKLEPGIIEEPLEKKAIPTISPDIITPFLTRPLIIEKEGLKNAPIIIGGPDNRVVYSAGTKVYINKIDPGSNIHWQLYRPGKTLTDPDTKSILGIEANYLGDINITKYGEPATAMIITAKEEVFVKDKLVEAPETIQQSFVPHAPDTHMIGRIVSIYGGLAETGRNSIVTINLGKDNGIEPGHVLSINRLGRYISKNPDEKKSEEKFTLKELQAPDKEPKVETPDPKNDPSKNPKLIKLPNERVGLLMVFRTFNKLSYGLVMQASEAINDSDLVETPESQ
jgi:hypothetical protein